MLKDTLDLEREILGNLWDSNELWDNLTYLCDTCNSRFAGTPDERRAGDFMMSRFQAYGMQQIAAEPFEMRGWERGDCVLTLHEGERKVNLPCLALPGSFACDLEAEIIDAGQGTPEDFQRLGASVAGKIVLTSSDGPGRGEKYSAALAAGAVAFIFSNAQPGLLAPTGSVGKELPAIGLAYEYAARIKRTLRGGPARVHLTIHATVLQVTARNIVGEIPGTDPQAGWILAGGHYDGHDICQGAQDNGASTAILIEAARILSPLRSHLKAGIRFVLFSGEELGLYGSYAYARAHAHELDPIRLVFNADVAGLAMPLVLRTQASPALAAYFRTQPLAELDAVVNDGPGSFIMNSDHFPFNLAGIPAVWALTSHPTPGTSWGHTAADTLDKIEPRILKQTAATVTRLLYRMAANAQELPRQHQTAAEVQHALTEAGFEQALRSSGRWPF